MSVRRLAFVALFLLAAGVGLVAGARPAAAHGGSVWIDDNYGAFHVVVQTSPTLNERQIRFTILVNQHDYGDPIKDAQVSLRLVPSGTVGSAVDTIDQVVPPEAGQDGFYDATVTLPRYGDWQAEIAVRRGTDQGTAGFAFPLQAPPGPDSPIWLIALLPVLAAAGIFIYFWRVPPRTKPPPAPAV